MEPQQPKNYIKIVGLVFAGIIGLAVVGYIVYAMIIPRYFPSKNVGPQGVDLSQAPISIKGTSQPAKAFDFKGTLYLSLIQTGGTDALGIYAYDLNGKDSKFRTIFAEQKTADKTYSSNISPSVSADGKKMVFARGRADGSALQIYTSDVSGANVQLVTRTLDKYKREPIFSPSGELIAYVSHNTKTSAKDPDPEIPESWSTYLVDSKGDAVKVSEGMNPIFSPDGKKLLVLKNFGLQAYDIADWKKPKSLGLFAPTVGGRASATMKIGISADGTMLAWPSLAKDNVIVYRIDSWDKFSISPLLLIQTKAYWTVFSPDGKYLAVEEWRKDASGNDVPVIVGYDLSNGLSEPIVTLLGYNKSYLWFGSWK